MKDVNNITPVCIICRTRVLRWAYHKSNRCNFVQDVLQALSDGILIYITERTRSHEEGPSYVVVLQGDLRVSRLRTESRIHSKSLCKVAGLLWTISCRLCYECKNISNRQNESYTLVAFHWIFEAPRAAALQGEVRTRRYWVFLLAHTRLGRRRV